MGSRAGFIVVFDVPENVSGKRGRPRIYGKNRIELLKVPSQSKSWLSIGYACRGVMVESRYQTFLATSRIARGVIRVVMVEHRLLEPVWLDVLAGRTGVLGPQR
jgi:hypothetical protein